MKSTAETEQLHAFWMTMWNYIGGLRDVLDEQQIQAVITSINKDPKHPFWGKLRGALLTTVVVPKEKSSVPLRIGRNIEAMKTSDWLKELKGRRLGGDIDIPVDLRRALALEQPAIPGDTKHSRFTFDADDLSVLGNIAKFFPHDHPGFSVGITLFRPTKNMKSSFGFMLPYSLLEIERLITDADSTGSIGGSMVVPGEENLFSVYGREQMMVVSVRKKLNVWRMRRVRAGDRFHSQNVYVFI